MKKLIIILALITPVVLKSQISLSTLTVSNVWTVTERASTDNYLSVKNDGSIIIDGDTMEIIKYLVKNREKKDSIIESQQNFINATVKFINNTGQIPRENNCYWPALLKQLRKNGYSYVKTKPTNICTNK